jgi:hypothetical protein
MKVTPDAVWLGYAVVMLCGALHHRSKLSFRHLLICLAWSLIVFAGMVVLSLYPPWGRLSHEVGGTLDAGGTIIYFLFAFAYSLIYVPSDCG